MIRFLDLETLSEKSRIYSSIDNREITKLHYDSRKINSEHGSIFFALTGESKDGHLFIENAFEKGVRQFVVSKETPYLQSIVKKANIVLVTDTLDLLQKISTIHRSNYNLPVIAITGSNGKTITKEWLALLLSTQSKVVKNPGSHNSQIGVPLSVWNITSEDEFGVFEAGISRPGEMEMLERIIQPRFGVLTNIGTAHDSGFNSQEEKIKEKLQLFKRVEKLIFRADNETVNKLVVENISAEKVTWSINMDNHNGSDYSVKWTSNQEGTQITLNDTSFFCTFKDKASLENATHCIVTALELSFDKSTIQQGLKLFKNLQKRLYITPGINHSTLVEDYYNNDLAGIEIALDFMNQYDRGLVKTAIISDIPQISESQKKETYQKIGEMLSVQKFSRLIGIGTDIKELDTHYEKEKEFYSTTEEFCNQFKPHNFHEESILIKGAREYHFEKIAELLQEKKHQTQLTINLNAAVQNLSFYRQKAEGTMIMGMVKALAYGSGAIEIAQLLQFNQIDYLGVAYTDEGRHLRDNGITVPIMVMNVHEDDLDLIYEHNLEAEIYSKNLLHVLDKYTRETGKDIFIHLKIDTGMNRLGFTPDDIEEVVSILINNPKITVRGCFSHLAAAESDEEKDFTIQQNMIFSSVTDYIENAIGHKVIKHILNSAGVLRYPDFHYDMVRIGIGIYGIDPSREYHKNLTPVNHLKTVVSQIKTLSPGDTVGYGRAGSIEKTTSIATIAIGYADGFHRSLGNGKGSVMINGQKAKTVGNICMDMTMIDVTGLNAKEGDEVEVFGINNPIQDLATEANTIPYEILTSISPRVKRIYTYE